MQEEAGRHSQEETDPLVAKCLTEWNGSSACGKLNRNSAFTHAGKHHFYMLLDCILRCLKLEEEGPLFLSKSIKIVQNQLQTFN